MEHRLERTSRRVRVPNTIARRLKVSTNATWGLSAIVGGAIGYSIEKDSDERCVKDYESRGFKKV